IKSSWLARAARIISGSLSVRVFFVCIRCFLIRVIQDRSSCEPIRSLQIWSVRVKTGSILGRNQNKKGKILAYARDGSRTHESLRNWILSPADLATFVPSRPIVFRLYNKKNRGPRGDGA